jgi:hypothetical protein
VQRRRPSQIYRLERVAGHGIIGRWRTRSAHLHRPGRATAEYAIAAKCRRFRDAIHQVASEDSASRVARSGIIRQVRRPDQQVSPIEAAARPCPTSGSICRSATICAAPSRSSERRSRPFRHWKWHESRNRARRQISAFRCPVRAGAAPTLLIPRSIANGQASRRARSHARDCRLLVACS